MSHPNSISSVSFGDADASKQVTLQDLHAQNIDGFNRLHLKENPGGAGIGGGAGAVGAGSAGNGAVSAANTAGAVGAVGTAGAAGGSFSQLLSCPSTPLGGGSGSTMALLSPPSSRYAFEPSLTTAAIPPISSVLMGGESAEGFPADVGNAQRTVPSFRPSTEARLETFTADLRAFARWIGAMQPQQQRTVVDVLLDNLQAAVLPYVRERAATTNAQPVPQRGAQTSAGAQAPSAAQVSNVAQVSGVPRQVSPPPMQPVSPLVMLGGESVGAQGMVAPVASMPVGSAMLDDPVARPRSAGPAQMRPARAHGARGMGMSGLTPAYSATTSPYLTGNPVESGVGSQPLFRVFSSDMDSSGFQRRSRDFFGEDARNQGALAQQFGLTSDFGGQNAMKLNSLMRESDAHAQSAHVEPTKQVQSAQAAPVHSVPVQPVQAPQKAQAPQTTNSGSSSASTTSPHRPRTMAEDLMAAQAAQAQAAHAQAAQTATAQGSTTQGSTAQGPAQSNGISRGRPRGVRNARDSPRSVSTSAVSPPSVVKSASPEDIASRRLLANIPLWLKTLRLHKYTDNLKSLRWEQMVELSDEDLGKLGVSTVGARNKLLKSFAYVKENLHD